MLHVGYLSSSGIMLHVGYVYMSYAVNPTLTRNWIGWFDLYWSDLYWFDLCSTVRCSGIKHDVTIEVIVC